MSFIYLWSAWDKTAWEFLRGDRLERIFLWAYPGVDLLAWPGARAGFVLASWGTLALEYALGVGLLFARTRCWLLPAGLLFHGLLYVTLPVRTFSATVWLLYLAYLDPDAVHRTIDRLQGAASRRA